MNKRNTNNIFRLRTLGAFLVFVFLSTSIAAQIKKGDKMFNKFEYERALTAYENEYNDNATANPYLTRRIGMTYRHLGDIESSAIWFKRTLDLDQSNKLDYLYYAESLKYLKEYEKSMEYYQLYATLDPNDHRANEHLSNPNYHEKLLSDTSQFTVKRLKMNNANAAFGITKYKDQYLFSSTGTPNPEVSQNYNVFDDNPYLDIFTAKRQEDGEFIDVERIKGEINSKFHDGPIAYDATRSQLYVTRNNVKRGRAIKDNTGRVNLKVYVFDELEDGEWSKGKDVAFNSNEYSVAHPSLSSDGNVVYFSSNQAGGFGGTDIYVSKRKENGDWSEAMNLGPQINTEGDESFPFISHSGILYFSSDGHPGLGGLDIFKSTETNGKWMDPINLAHPINSEKDDISFVSEADEKSGYFSSNRVENQIGDDIYAFKYTPLVKINAFVRDKYTLLPIEGVIAKIYDEGGFVIFEGMSDENGYLEVSIIKGKCNYKMTVGENMNINDLEYDLSLCDEENKSKAVVDLGIIELGEAEYAMTLTAEDIEKNELIADVYTKIYDLETKELIFESLVAENDNFAMALEPNRVYRVDVTHDDYEMVTREFRTSEDKNVRDIDLSVSMLAKDLEYSMSLTAEDIEKNELIADVYTKIYDLETKELIFESLVAENENLAMALEPNRVYRVEVSHDEYDMVTREFRTSDDKSVRDIDLAVGMSAGELEYSIELTAEDVAKSELIADVFTKVYDLETKELIFESLVAENGKLALALKPDREYRVDVSHDEYKVASQEFRTSEDKNLRDIDLAVSMFAKDKVENIRLENIYYDFDKSDLRSDAKVVLDNLVALMTSNPEINIDMSSHTDSRGSNAYNMALSDRRENSAMNYLLQAGIDASRLSSSHHGEEQLANNCANGVKCSEDNHQLNRRTSFIILNPEALAANQAASEGIITTDLEAQFDDLAQSVDQNDDISSNLDFMFAA